MVVYIVCCFVTLYIPVEKMVLYVTRGAANIYAGIISGIIGLNMHRA